MFHKNMEGRIRPKLGFATNQLVHTIGMEGTNLDIGSSTLIGDTEEEREIYGSGMRPTRRQWRSHCGLRWTCCRHGRRAPGGNLDRRTSVGKTLKVPRRVLQSFVFKFCIFCLRCFKCATSNAMAYTFCCATRKVPPWHH